RTLPSMRAPPPSAISAAKVRENPSILARAASTREPSSPSGTGSERLSMSAVELLGRHVLGARGALQPHADEDDHGDGDHVAHDEDVGDVVDRRRHPRDEPHPRGVDEVDDMAHGESRLPEEPIAEVAEDPAEKQTQ